MTPRASRLRRSALALAVLVAALAGPATAASAPTERAGTSAVNEQRTPVAGIAQASKKSSAAKKKAAKKKSVSKATIDKIIKQPYPPKMTTAQAQAIAKRVRAEPKPSKIKYAKSEPATRAAWEKVFYSLPDTEWGGGDVSVSVKLASGRRFWIYGDTLSKKHGMVHSSAIVTTGKKARVANGGGQILPVEPVKKGRKTVYWTETLTPLAGEYVLVTTTPVSLKIGGGLFDFHRTDEKKSRQGLIHVDPKGDVRFIAWTGWVKRPNIGMDGDDFASPKKGHFTYAAFVHPIKLKNGKFLRTRNRNYEAWVWGGGWPNDVKMFRPTFEESSTRNSPYWGR